MLFLGDDDDEDEDKGDIDNDDYDDAMVTIRLSLQWWPPS